MTENNKKVKEINYDVVNRGPLFIPDEYKQPGYVYQWVADEARGIYTYQKWGYETVHKDEIPEVGQETPSRSTKYSDCVTVDSRDGLTLVLMKIPVELHEALMKHRHDKVKQIEASIGKLENTPEDLQYGEITYKKR